MEKAIRGEFVMSKTQRRLWLLGLTVFLGLSVFIYFKLYANVMDIVRSQAVNSITNISELNEDSLSRSIRNRELLIEMISYRLSKREVEDVDIILRELQDFVGYYEFYNMGVMDVDKTLYLTDGRVLDVAGVPLYEDAWSEEFHLSPSYIPKDGDGYALNVFSYPIYLDGEVRYVLTATYRSSNLTERMNINSMGGKGYNFILNCQGEVVIYPRHYENHDYNSLMEYINDISGIIPDDSGDRFFTYDGDPYYAHFERLGINNWFLMTCAREADVFADANAISRNVMTGMGLLWMMVLAAILAAILSLIQSKSQLRKAVFYDELLNVGNGNLLPVFFKSLPRDVMSRMTLTIFDIDKFKEFNYIYGEECGDNLLKYIVRAFQEELPGEHLFRYLADHFVALIQCSGREEFKTKMDRFLHRCEEDIGNGKIQPFDISAGVRRVREGDSFRRVVSDALVAKGTVKGIQLQQYAFYEEAVLQKRMHYMEMESDFSRALKAHEFQVFYQPKYDMITGRIIGAEALVRWVKADGSVISPGAFIPCFEASRQIILMDEAMLEAVCSQMNEMKADGLPVKRVSVNLSRVHLRHHGILPKIERIVKSSGVDADKLSFEITESALYEDSIPLKHIVDFLHQLGCQVDMDDYGIGVSGPSALAANRFDVLKMDKSFIDGIGDPRMEAVIKSTITLTKTLGMEVLAEGVEEKHQADCLAEWGCTQAQGFYYSRPVPQEEYRRLLMAESRRDQRRAPGDRP
ncbi:MAG: EAL domain-containing protein [Eubacteriales bacterium]|nr:EAL domain-containing protein [Eubacteriales bacterium]